MGQNQYNRSYDNDREPAPEETFRSRLRRRGITLRESFEDVAGDFRKMRRSSKERKEERREKRRKKQRAAEGKRAAQKQVKKEEDASAERKAERRYGKDEFANANRIRDGRIFEYRDAETGKRKKKILLTARFLGYLLLVAVALCATQVLKSKVTNIFVSFLLLLPIGLLLYTLVACRSLYAEMLSQNATVYKNEGYVYEMLLRNTAPFAFPFIEAIMILPQSNGVRCDRRSVYLSMGPLGTYRIRNEVRFRFRGTYEIGVDCFYVYDFFRMFRVRVDVGSAVTLLVLPRRLLMEDNETNAVSDETDRSVRSLLSVDRVEIGDIREYIPGDPLKSVHWNLSSRSEDLIIKDYNSGSTKKTYIYCDLATRFPEEPPARPSLSRADVKRAKRYIRERKNAEKRKKRVLARAEKRGRELSEETLADLEKTAHERKVERGEARLADKRAKQAASLTELQKKNPMKAAALRDRLYDEERKAAFAREEVPSASVETRDEDAHLLASDRCYEDMNEYCADGVIELTVASALRELRRGSEVVLIWYDRRSDSGMCVYSFRDLSGLESIYPLFATAPLAPREKFVAGLSVLAGDISSVKQIFVTSSVDRESMAAFSALTNIGGGEILLYNPEERFLFPEKRRSYIEGCKEALSRNGFHLVSGDPNGQNVREVKNRGE